MGLSARRAAAAFLNPIRQRAGLLPPGRNVEVRNDDVFLTSYPRSGNTWMRFMVTSLLSGGTQPEYERVQQAVPDIYKQRRRNLEVLPSPRILKSHQGFDPHYPRVVYMVRDPRDVAVSYFHFQVRSGHLSPEVSIADFVDAFVAGKVDGYGRWDDHVRGWLQREEDPSFLFTRYEDMISEPETVVDAVSSFLGIRCEPETARDVVRSVSFLKMSSAVANPSGHGHPKLVRAEQEGMVRKGMAGAWVDELPTELAHKIEKAFAVGMTEVGYLEEGPRS